ncbi:MAG: hypothetical protein SFW36_19385 [Leptolyngbyaceae cyanobacterium bins.59]|nr:hypothetical protein [Leptolyngbyaceae cyanobacterium bins.59]
MPRQLPEKCRLCAKLHSVEAKRIHGPEGDGCWDSRVCPNRRSHARHRQRRNLVRSLRRKQQQAEQRGYTGEWVQLGGSVGIVAGLQTITVETPPIQTGPFAVLHAYRRTVDAPLHAIGGEVWQGQQKVALIKPVHCLGLTPRDVERYLEKLLEVLEQSYGIRKFASLEELHPLLCPLEDCPLQGK